MKTPFYFLFVFALLFTACNDTAIIPSEAGISHSEYAPIKNTADIPTQLQNQKLIKDGTLSFQCENSDETHNRIIHLTEKFSGFIARERSYSNDFRSSTVLEVKIPSKQFDSFIDQLAIGVDGFDNKEISVKDVTEQFVDIETRLKTKKELEKRYLQLLSKTDKISEIVALEKEINTIRTEIESAEGKLKYLANKVDLSTISITFYQENPQTSSLWYDFTQGIKNGGKSLITFLIALVNIWPFILIAVMVVFGFRKWRKRRSAVTK